MKSKKKNNKKPKSENKPVNKKVEDTKPEEFDFGGIPDRDIKKNLGCG